VQAPSLQTPPLPRTGSLQVAPAATHFSAKQQPEALQFEPGQHACPTSPQLSHRSRLEHASPAEHETTTL
jgi:hypothetical protein